MSKLYTEEQMKLFYELGKFDGIIGKKYNIDEEIKKLTPIELPTDEEIEQFIGKKTHKYYAAGFDEGAKWMKDKIKGGNK